MDKVILGRWAWLYGLTSMEEAILKKKLTVQPRLVGDFKKEKPLPIHLYKYGGDGSFGVPIGYFKKNTSWDYEIRTAFAVGDDISDEVSSLVRYDGHFKEQRVAIDTLLRYVEDEEWGGMLLEAPPGTGKTVMALQFAYELGKKTMILVHKEFFINQWTSRIKEFFPNARIGLVKQKVCVYKDCDFVIGSIQSMYGERGNKYPKEMYDSFGLIISDEIHRVGSNKWSQVIPKFNVRWKLGLSVGPDSVCWLRGGVFGDFWVGDIESAFNILIDSGYRVEPNGEYDLIRINGIKSRGFDGKEFRWKDIKTFIRHECDRDIRSLKIRGKELVVTDDHSIFKVIPSGDKINKKNVGKIVVSTSDKINKGDVVLSDTGDNWDEKQDLDIDIVNVINGSDKTSVVKVAVDLSEMSNKDVRLKLGVDHRVAFQWRKGGKYGGYLPFDIYVKHKDYFSGKFMYWEGASGITCPMTIQLSSIAYLLGFYLGNGWITNNTIGLAVKPSVLSKVEGYVSIFTKGRFRTRKSKNGNSYEVLFNNVVLAEFLRLIGISKKAHDKRFLPSFFEWSRHKRMELLDGLMDSDGSSQVRSRGRHRCTYSTSSKGLAHDVDILLVSLGVHTGVSIRKPCDGGMVNGRVIKGNYDNYLLNWSYSSMTGKEDGHRGKRQRYCHVEKYDESVVGTVITGIKKPKYVYDLEMSGHPSFVANGVLVHNSATFRRADRAENVFYYQVGPIVYSVKTESMIPDIRRVVLETSLEDGCYAKSKHGGRYHVPFRKMNSAQILSALADDRMRSREIVGIIYQAVIKKRKVMVVSERLQHLREMDKMLNEKLAKVKLSFNIRTDFYVGEWFTGKLNKKGEEQRKTRTRRELENAESANVIWTTKQMTAEGLDIPSLDVLVISLPISDPEQMVGRVRRYCTPDKDGIKCGHYCPWRTKCKGKPTPIVVDIIDRQIFRVKQKWNSRAKYYRKIGALKTKDMIID